MSTSEEAVLRLDFERNLPVLQHWGLQLSREQEQSVKDYLTRFYDDSLWQKPGTVEIDLRSVPQVCGRWSLTVTPQAADGRFRVLELRRPADEMRRNQARGVVLGGDRGAGGELSGGADERQVVQQLSAVATAAVPESTSWTDAYLLACEGLMAGLPEESCSLLRGRLCRLRELKETAPQEFLLMALLGQLEGLSANSEQAKANLGAAPDQAIALAAVQIVRWQLSKLRGALSQGAAGVGVGGGTTRQS